jgi:hypothetical protein
MPNPQESDSHRRVLQEAQINRALGLFLLFFAGVLAVSILFTPTLLGRLTNLAAGGIIGLIGGMMVWRSRRAGASARRKEL